MLDDIETLREPASLQEIGSRYMHNPDQALIHQFQNGDTALAIDSNALAPQLGGHLLHVNRDSGRVDLSFAPGSLFTQGGGVIQGGIVCAMLDFAMAFAVLARLPAGETAVTVNLNTSYLRAVRQGKLLVTGLVDRLGTAAAFATARLTAQDGLLLATASSTLFVVKAVPC
jgi:uncharacterized protein (TIGR00369 family)